MLFIGDIDVIGVIVLGVVWVGLVVFAGIGVVVDLVVFCCYWCYYCNCNLVQKRLVLVLRLMLALLMF